MTFYSGDRMNITVIYPKQAPKVYKICAEEFCRLCGEITGETPRMITDDIPIDSLSHTKAVVIGGKEVNRYAAHYKGKLPVTEGTDGYFISTAELCGNTALFLWGGRGRSTLYAVYRYFEKFLSCRWFWDKDVIPRRSALPFENVFLAESTANEYRGTRYFAHRGLHRFQAEHWNASDWQREIDWLLKKRLNMFMLRIGQDDLFQKAFPDTVPYPPSDKPLPFTGDGFNDRTLFWDLRFRGDLRRQILEYAIDRDMITPEDCGTMTHWYSRTPVEFLEKVRPQLLSQPKGTNYADATGLVWDIRKEENLELYFRLTDTHVKEYGQEGVFHTIGLAERAFSESRQENMRLKRLTYRLICQRLKETYPNSGLLLASWDMWMFYTPEEVSELLDSMDREQTILFDYTSDSARKSNLQSWGVEHKFPYVFGIFHAYEPSNEIRGDYQELIKRLARTKGDPFCKGVVFWPELSHGDPFMTEFFASNAWQIKEQTVDEQLEEFCVNRYAESEKMLSVWKTVLPLAKLMSWSKYEEVTPWVETDIFCRAAYFLDMEKDDPRYDDYLLPLSKMQTESSKALEELSSLWNTENEMQKRDCFDLARTVITRYLNGAFIKICREYIRKNDTRNLQNDTTELLQLYTRLLGENDEFTLYHTLEKLKKTHPVNPAFTPTLKRNCDNLYCRSNIYECARDVYLPETKMLFDMLSEGKYDKELLLKKCEQNRISFEKAPLIPNEKNGDIPQILLECADIMGRKSFSF
ncbi:MAG: hypothetical protein E7674_07060 [Ruminococcaceae bacterium]|nr:hypothetical protein [Oscillospiraceae bacterium]